MTTKSFSSTDPNTKAFYNILHQLGVKDEEIDGAVALKPGDKAPAAAAKKDGQITSQEVVAFVFNNFVKYQAKIQEHFKKLGVDISWIKSDGSIDEAKKKELLAKLGGKGPGSLEQLINKKELPTSPSGAVSPFLVNELIRGASKSPEFALLSLGDQETAILDYLKSQKLGEGQIQEISAELKQELAGAAKNQTLEKKVAAAALIQGRELAAQAREKAAAGDAKGAKALRTKAAQILNAAVEMHPAATETRMELAGVLSASGDKEGAGFQLDRVLHFAAGSNNYDALESVQAFLEKSENADLLPPGENAWALIGDRMMEEKQYDLATFAYGRGQVAAEKAKNQPLADEFGEKYQLAYEAKQPYATEFGVPAGEKTPTNPAANSLYLALKAQGIPAKAINQVKEGESDDKTISTQEVFDYITKHLEDPRVQTVLKQAKIDISEEDKKSLRALGFGFFMAERFAVEADRLKKEDPKNIEGRGQLLVFAAYFQPDNAARYQKVGEFYEEQEAYGLAIQAYSQALEIHNSQPVRAGGSPDATQGARDAHAAYAKELGNKIKSAHDKGIEKGWKKYEALAIVGKPEELKSDLPGQLKVLQDMEAQYEILLKNFPEEGKRHEKLKELGEIYDCMGQTLLAMGKKREAKIYYAKAVETYQNAINANKNDAAFCIEVYQKMGASNHEMGEYKQALIAYSLASQCLKLRIHYDPQNPSKQLRTLNDVKQDRAPGHWVGIDAPNGNYIHSEVHNIRSVTGLDELPYWAAGPRDNYIAKTQNLLTELSQRRAELEKQNPLDSAKLLEVLEEEGKLLVYFQRDDEAKALGEKAVQFKNQEDVKKLKVEVQTLAEAGVLNAKGMEDEAAKSKPEGGEPLKMSSYLSVEKVGDKTQIKFSPDFEKLDAATQKKVLEIAFQSGQRSHLTQAMEKAKGPAKLYYEGQIALLDGDRISAKTKFTQFLEQAKGSEDKAVKALVAQAEGFVESLEQKDVKTPDDVLNDTRKLLGPLVTPLHQGPDGALVLTPEGMKEIATFEDFRKFLATQVSVDGIAFNAVLFANYEKVINDPKHEALLRHLYAQFKPDAKGEAPAMDLAKLQQAFANFQKDVAKVSVSRFVSRHLNSAEGRKKLRALLKDPCLDTSFKLDVIEEIIDVGASEGMTPPHIRALFDKHIGRERTAREILEFASPLHHLASGVSEANAKFEESKIGLATRYGLKVLAEGDRVEFERGLQIDKYENYPHEVQRLNADDYSASVYQIKDRVKLIRSLEKKSDGISQMRTKLAHCWLLVIDNDNWGITRHKDLHQDFVSPAQRAFMARKLDELMREGEEVATNEQFTAWNKKIHDFLNGHGYPDGVEAVNWVRGELGGATVDGFFQGLKPSVAKAYSDLRRYSDEFDAAEDMGMATDVTEPRLQVLDGKRVESSVKLIQDLRGIQRSFWYQYKQRNFLSRAAFSELDKDLIRKANTEIDGIIQAVQDAKTDEDFAAIQQRITRACKEDGAIHKGYAAAEMDGTQHIYNLIQTIAEIVVIEVATGGTASAAAFGRAALTAARIGRATRSLEIGFKVFQTERRIAEAARIARAAEALEMANIGRYGSYAKDVEALEATGALSKADAAAARQMLGLSTRLVQAISTDAGFAAKGYESFKLGVKISTAENLTALLSGQLHEKPKTILDWLKDALSTGGSMVVSAALEPTVAAHLEKNLFKNLWQRWVAQGPKGALHFLGDAGLEVVEEVVDQYVRKKLDGDFRSLSWEEFKDIVLICGFGAAKQGMISHLVSFPKTLRAQKAIEGFHLRGEKVVFDQKSEKNFVVDRNGNIIREATKGEPALFMAYEAETKGEASKGISVFQFESTEKGSKGSLVEVSLAELPIVQPAPQAVTPQKKPAPTAADADRVRAENIQKFKDERTTNLYREFSEGGKVVEKFKKNGAPDGIEVRDAQGNKLRDGTVDELKAFQAYQELIKGFDERGERIIGTPSKGFQLVSKDGKTVIREAKAWEKQLFDQFEKQALFFQKAPEVPRPGVAPGQALPFQLGRQLEEGDSDLGTLDLYKVTIQTAKGPEEVSARLDPEVSKQFGSAEKNLQHALAFIDVNKSYPTANGGSLRFTGAILGQGSASTIYQAVHTTVDPVSGKKIETPVAVKLRTHPRPPRFMGPDAAKYDHGVWEADMLARPHVDDKILKEVSQVDPAYRALGLVRMQGGHEGIMMPHFPHEHCQFFLKLSELPKEDQKIAAPQIKRIADHFMRLGHGLGDVEFVYDRRTKQVHLVDIEGVMLNDAHIAKDKKFMYRFLDVETESPAQDADQLLAASRRAAAPIDVDGKNKPPTPPPPASSGSLSQPGPQPILVTAKGEFLPISFQSGNVVNFSLGGQRVEIIAREGGGHELRLLGPQTTTFQVYDSATKTWTSYNSEVQPGVTLTNGTRVKYGDVEFTWYPSGDSTEARQRVAAPLVQGDFQARVNVHPEAAKNGTAHQAIGRWAIEHPKEYSDFLKGKGILTVRHDGMVFREVNGEPVRRRVLRATEAVLKLGKERGLDKETIKAAAKEAGAHAAFNPSLIGTTAFERIANRFLDEAEMKKIPDPKEIYWLAQTNSPFAAAAQDYKAGKTNPLQYAKAQRAVSQKLIDEHKAAFDDVMGTLKTIANDPTIRASKEHPPIGRMKAVGDIGPKMARREYQDLTPMTDIAATRIIVQNNADVEAVIAKIQEKYKVREVYTKEGDIDVELMNPEAAKEFMKEWGFQPETDVVYVDAKLDKDGIHRLVEGHPASGYRALHVVVEVDGKPVEIQIKTEPMAEWGEIEHKLVYKNKDLPPEVLNPIKEYRKKVADFLAHANEAKAGDKLQAMPIPPDVPIGTPGRDEIQGRLQQMGNLMEKTRAAALQRGALPPG